MNPRTEYMRGYRKVNSVRINRENRARNQQRREQGVCTICGNTNDNLPNTRCVKCRLDREKYIKNHISKRIKLGVCIRCGGAKTDNKRCCTICNAKQNELSRRSRKKDPDRYRLYSIKQRKTVGHRWSVLNTNAKQRNLKVELTKDEYLIKCKSGQLSICNYCGGENLTLGLDRIDNTKGYKWNNVISCCELCNKMKRILTQEEFSNHIKQIHSNWATSFDPKKKTITLQNTK